MKEQIGNDKDTEETDDWMSSRKAGSQSHGVGNEKVRSPHLPWMMERSNDSEETQTFTACQQYVKESLFDFFGFSW